MKYQVSVRATSKEANELCKRKYHHVIQSDNTNISIKLIKICFPFSHNLITNDTEILNIGKFDKIFQGLKFVLKIIFT